MRADESLGLPRDVRNTYQGYFAFDINSEVR